MREGERRWAVSSTIGESERASSTYERGSSARTKLFVSRDLPSSILFLSLFFYSLHFFLSFPFLSFPFLSFPFLSFPFLSFPFLSLRFVSPPLFFFLSFLGDSNGYFFYLFLFSCASLRLLSPGARSPPRRYTLQRPSALLLQRKSPRVRPCHQLADIRHFVASNADPGSRCRLYQCRLAFSAHPKYATNHIFGAFPNIDEFIENHVKTPLDFRWMRTFPSVSISPILNSCFFLPLSFSFFFFLASHYVISQNSRINGRIGTSHEAATYLHSHCNRYLIIVIIIPIDKSLLPYDPCQCH